MRIGWRKYIAGKFKKASPFYALGIEISPDSVHLSVLKNLQGHIQWSLQHEIHGSDWGHQLKDFVAAQSLANTPTYVAIAPDAYHSLQVDKPAVNDNEVAQALQWSIRDLVATSEELVVDYYDLPVNTAGANKLNVVAVPKSFVKTIAECLFKLDLPLMNLGVSELATCELVSDSDEAVMTLIQQAGQEVCLNIVKNGQLYFSRRLKGYENLASFTQQELEMGVVDNLSVEVQRSMDFFESQLRQAPVKKILIGLDCKHQQTLAALMQKLMFMPVEELVADIDSANDLKICAASYTSLGAAMTHGRAPLSGGGQ